MKSTRLILNSRIIVSGLLAVLVSTDLYAVPPVISSASMSDGTVTVSGENFGQKAVAAPHKFQPFTGTSHGQTYSQVGFDFVGGNNSDTQHNYCDMSDGVGGGSWLHRSLGGGHESFSHFGHLLPDPGVDAVYVSYWVRITRTGTPRTIGAWGQYKGIRSGPRRGTDPYGDMYRGPVGFSFSQYTRNDPVTTPSGPTAYTGCGQGCGTTTYPDPPHSVADVQLIGDIWNFCEVYYKMNDYGQANGEMQVRFNGTQHHNLRGLTIRTSPSDFLGFVQYNPGLAHPRAFGDAIWQVRYSRIYTDTTRARVFLGNAPTLAGCQGRFLLPPTAWSDTSVSAGSAVNVPPGYDWVYVSNSDGEINEIGYISPPARPRRLRVR